MLWIYNIYVFITLYVHLFIRLKIALRQLLYGYYCLFRNVTGTYYYAPGDDSPHGGILLLLCPYVCMYVCMYVRVRLKFSVKVLVKVLYWFKLYLMLSKHFIWTV